MNRDVLVAIARRCKDIETIRQSAETGAGRTSLLLSHLSEHHIVFAKDDGRSITETRACPLLRAEHVAFVEGPTQRSVPAELRVA
jgi:hypothetical protein